jgi:hypothetical protein
MAFSFQPAYRGVAMDGDSKPLFSDEFTGGKPDLEWVPYPHFNRDNLYGALDPPSPGAEPGVGVLDNRKVGGFAALAYANTAPVSDFYLETWLYAQVVAEDKGPLNGIAFRVDPAGDKFYRLAAHFTAEPSLTKPGLRGQRQQSFSGLSGAVESRGPSRGQAEPERLASSPHRSSGR